MSKVIHDSPQYRVTSYGKGSAYLVECKRDAPLAQGLWPSFHVQGEDASAFHDAIFEQDVFSYDVAISQLYSEAFSPTGAAGDDATSFR